LHSAAGAGLAHLHLWAATGDATLGRRAAECADGLLAAAAERDGELIWPIPATPLVDRCRAGSRGDEQLVPVLPVALFEATVASYRGRPS